MSSDVIYFYREREAYGCFSNFSRHPIVLKGKKWLTTEHYFQAMKFEGTAHEDKVRNAMDPTTAKKIGNNRALPLRKDWEQVKEDIMKEALMAKFTQHPNIQQTLLSTCERKIVEHTRNDHYWGDGGDGSGKNRLGVLLMQVRRELLQQQQGAQPQKSDEDSVNSNDSANDVGDNNEKEDEEGEPEIEKIIQEDWTGLASGEQQKKGRAVVKKKPRYMKKQQVFVDNDGSSKVERKTDEKGQVRLVGDGTVFSEKALPPAGKLAVYRNQMVRKYQVTEDDFPDDEEENYDDEPVRSKNYSLGDFMNIPQSKTPTEDRGEKLSIPDCIKTAVNHIELLSELRGSPEAQTIIENCKYLRSMIEKYIQEESEKHGDTSTYLEDLFDTLEKLSTIE